ncbi:alpha/beta fold hydrolase [Halorussus sp. AFM4]|uniref:alpha/beta fold hydrolase n=1 Tax=Halorussus sp. AFM4 TaxID=3421651 RepID=UPI003EBEB9A4
MPDATALDRPPAWLDRTEYPFDPKWLDRPAGRVHYVDEGEGRPVVLLHGNPTWSFLYRHLIRGLSDEYRCVAPDLLGFGRSAKPSPSDFSYRPAAHARVVERLIDDLGLRDPVVVGHDWGGPLALDYATRNPDAVSGIAALNTWMWPRERLLPRVISRAVGNPAGRYLVLRHNAFARTAVGLPHVAGLGVDETAYRHYLGPLGSPADRIGSWTLVRELLGSRDWLAALWDRRAAVADTSALLLWGARDPVQGPLLRRWQALFPAADTVVYDGVGHFVPEEVGPDLVGPVRRFLRRNA